MKKKRYMLDTNICSFIMRGSPPSVREAMYAALKQKHECVISAIVYMEMRLGAHNPKAPAGLHQRIDRFLQSVEVLPYDKAAVDASGIVHEQLARQRQLIGDHDVSIAGHCIAEGCILVTNNTREFKRVEGLDIEDWVQ